MLTQIMERMAPDALVGLDVGSSAIKLAELSSRGGALTLRRWAIESRTSAAASQDVRHLWKRLGFSHNHVAVSVASPELVVKPFDVPKMPRRELAGAIRLEAEQATLNGHRVEDMVTDWHVLASTESVRGVVSVVPKATLEARLATVRDAGLAPRVVDVDALAVWNAWWALAGSRHPSSRTIWLLNIGARTTNLVIAASPDRLLLVRDAQLGAEAFGTDAEGDWAMELRDSLAYARSLSGLRELAAVVVTGGGALHAHAVPLITRIAAGVPVERWNPCDGLALDEGCPAVAERDGMRLAVALGLAPRKNG